MNDIGPPPKPKVGTVGMVLVTCPACGENVETDVRVDTVKFMGGGVLRVDFHYTEAEHPNCPGRRS